MMLRWGTAVLKGMYDMDILAFAMKMEKDGETFYREMAKKTTNTGLANILEMLADEEVKHYEAIRSIQAGSVTLAETDVLGRAKNIFQRIRDFGDPLNTATDQIQLYRQAMDIEKQSEDFYNDRADQVKEKRYKELFLKLAAEEEKHYFLLENVVDFISRPKSWLENSEFNHLEEY
jgi:rubrerythrin